MIVDTSAIMAIVLGEDEWKRFADAIADDPMPTISAGTWIELAAVSTRSHDSSVEARVADFVRKIGFQIAPVTVRQAEIGHAAYRKYGRGSGHRAYLNFGDCFTYALAMETGEPLLFKGDDFIHTDIRSAL